MRDICIDILLCFLDRDHVNTTELSTIDIERQEKWLNDDQIYLGIRVMNKITQPEIRCHIPATKEFFHRFRHFLITSAKEIKKRYDLESK